jgi:hypothetical protein
MHSKLLVILIIEVFLLRSFEGTLAIASDIALSLVLLDVRFEKIFEIEKNLFFISNYLKKMAENISAPQPPQQPLIWVRNI